MPETLQALVLGDIVGHSGCRALFLGLKGLVKKTGADLVIANGENAADGAGLTPGIVGQLISAGVDVITSGNHIWQKKEIYPTLEDGSHVIRPANYPKSVPGKGYCIANPKGIPVAVVNLQGRVRLYDVDSPFLVARELARRLAEEAAIIIIDFHAEDTTEKESLGIFLDGKVSAVVGTHTHVQTADERILPGGTAYITDIGMTGPIDSVIGVAPSTAVRKSLTQMPLKMEVSDNPSVIRGVLISINAESGSALAIKRIVQASSL